MERISAMKYEYCASDPKHFAQALRYNAERRKLLWDNSPGHDSIIVQTPFGQSAEDCMCELCEQLGHIQLESGVFVQVMTDVFLRYVTAKEKARDSGCPLNAESCTYTVFACLTQGDKCTIFAPLHQTMSPAVYDAPKEIHIDVAPEMKSVRRGLFGGKEDVFTGYFRITLPKSYDKSCVYGNLYYRVGKYTLPITPMMFDEGTVYVKSSEKPEIVSTAQGLKLV